MNYDDAILCIAANRPNLYFAAFDHQIVFGGLVNKIFSLKSSFQFFHYEYFKIFVTLSYIVKAISDDTQGRNGVIVKRDTYEYIWECVHEPSASFSIIFRIVKSEEKIYEIILDSKSLNDIIRLIGLLMLPSLKIKPIFFPIFQYFYQLDLDQLLKLQGFNQIQTLLISQNQINDWQLSTTEIYHSCIILDYHFDIIIAVNKILSLYNAELSSTNQHINEMEECI